jgi:hypothetical protein
MLLLKKAYDTLEDGGLLVIYEQFIDNERRSKTNSLLVSLNIHLVSGGSQFTYQ